MRCATSTPAMAACACCAAFRSNVPAGKIVALLGANGAGKTTLMRAIAGLATIHGGSITLGGETVTGRAPEALVREGLVLVPQGRLLFGDMTVRENLEMGAYHGRRPRHLASAIVTRRSAISRSCANAPARWRRSCRAASSRCWRWRAR